MDHGQQEPLTHNPFRALAEAVQEHPIFGAVVERATRNADTLAELAALPGAHFETTPVTLRPDPAINTTAPEGDRQPPPAGLLGRAARVTLGSEVGAFRERLERELMRAATCSVCHERACAQVHEAVFEGFSYWCGDCGYCEPDSTHDGCSGTLRRVRVTARVDEPS